MYNIAAKTMTKTEKSVIKIEKIGMLFNTTLNFFYFSNSNDTLIEVYIVSLPYIPYF